MTDWTTVPKVELHLHLEGAAPPDFIRALADRKGVTLDHVFDDKGRYRWTDFASFLDTYMSACTVLQTPDDYRALTEAVLRASASHGVIYTEVFVAPDICGGGDAAAWADYLAAIGEGAGAARDATGIEARFIAVCIRNHGADAALRAARLAADHKGAVLTGFGMAGDERFGHAGDYVQAFAHAATAGLGLTCHAGELCGADSVRATLDHLPVSRIGHGVRAIEDPDLVRRLADEGVVLEVSPGSNIALGLFPDWHSHPVAALRRAGVPVTVSTDDPPYFHTDMTREYTRLADTFGWGLETFRQINLTGAHAAFCDERTRTDLITRLTRGSLQ